MKLHRGSYRESKAPHRRGLRSRPECRLETLVIARVKTFFGFTPSEDDAKVHHVSRPIALPHGREGRFRLGNAARSTRFVPLLGSYSEWSLPGNLLSGFTLFAASLIVDPLEKAASFSSFTN
jgi:hypothetical protein